ncbi:ISAs1 family transposase [Archangium violaceum]|uniref:ISAs1 family transposase n=2 Tax=Archangium violaceum TaxID=83451 RepID=UPI00193C355D|nr:ISAs1 family transposase [Archangium violaceum]QRK07355.1 ISAs1 family transposase [Archangium violaceum]QRK07472.1 ISAs1 family transposase [Archangium violaceum]QRK08249.1 ISAs1 family transposase [Archangium violaceum]QRK09920.1 ISAs1 family transposase [Archangium violaceum]QRK10569.1 ISAs1 family transposase [Archangium violaceum]
MSGKKNRGGRTGGPSTPQAGNGKGKKDEQETPSRVQRMMASLGLTFKEVKDPRARRGQRHPLAAMLMLLVQALAVGRRVLRHAEALGEDMLREGTAPEGLKRPVSDTTLDRLLGKLEPEGLEQEVHQMVHRGLEVGLIRHELFARGVVSIDGKAGESTPGQPPCEPSHTTKDEQGREYWYPYALRASLTSSAAQPVLDQKLLEGKQGEATAFPELFKRVVEKFGRHFEYVTVDAGMTSAANARVVREAGKHYLMALKENFHRLHDKAWVALAVAPVKVRTRERTSGEWVERELRVVDKPPEEDFPGAQQWVWVRQTRTRDGELPKVETRLFLTSIPTGQLSPERMLTLVRRHWGIENGPNWTADVVLEEDSASPSLRGNAPLVLSWLRLLAYNLLALVRTHLPTRDKRPQSFARTMEVLYQGLLGLAVLPESLATLA